MTPQETVERALAAARCDDCIVIADENSTANLRWAANSLTTNGVARSRRLTVIAITRGSGGPQAGVVSRAGVRADQIADVVAAAESAARQSSPAEDAQPLLGPDDPEAFGAKESPQTGQPGWDDEPDSTGIGVFATFSPALGEAFAAAAVWNASPSAGEKVSNTPIPVLPGGSSQEGCPGWGPPFSRNAAASAGRSSGCASSAGELSAAACSAARTTSAI